GHTAMPPRRKKLAALVKVQLPAAQATPAPPVGTALGPHGVNIMDFVKQYNAATESQRGNIIPVEISIYEDRTFSFITKTPRGPLTTTSVGDSYEAQQVLPPGRRADRPRAALQPRRGGQHRQGGQGDEVRPDRRGGPAARRRPAQAGPDGPRHGQPAERDRQ